MKHYKKIREQPFRKILNDEWRRAKKMFPLVLKKKPKFYWALTRQAMKGRTHGRCNYTANYIIFHRNYLRDQIFDQNFLNIIRHEITHLIIPDHSSEFVNFCERLGGTRYATATFKKKK